MKIGFSSTCSKLIPLFSVTEQLIRKKSEHNEMIISTLEELSLHQENIDEIDHVQDWCRDLEILLLQGNLISRIEKLGKLKKLHYLNLALNNIETVQNLEKLESLHKLDLTLNFIGDLESLSSLKDNYKLRELILTGNPCTDYPGYRQYVIHTLPQLEILDSANISKSDRLAAALAFPDILSQIQQHQEKYHRFRVEQRIRVAKQIQENRRQMELIPDEEERNKFFWDSKCEHSPESRVDLANRQMENDRRKQQTSEKVVKKAPRRLFLDNGQPLNINEAKLDFLFRDLVDSFELELFIPKFLDTELLSVDVETNFIRVLIKQQIFQLALQEDIRINESSSKRSQITGHLVIRMPKLNYDEIVVKERLRRENKADKGKFERKSK